MEFTISALRGRGISLGQIRDHDFKIKGSKLSRIQIGLDPIPERIKNLLILKYEVNWEYIEHGKMPMFTGNKLSNAAWSKSSIYYAETDNLKELLQNILEHDYNRWKGSDKLFEGIRAFLFASNFIFKGSRYENGYIGLGVNSKSELDQTFDYLVFDIVSRKIDLAACVVSKRKVNPILIEKVTKKEIEMNDNLFFFPILGVFFK